MYMFRSSYILFPIDPFVMQGLKRYKETVFQRFESETLCCFTIGFYSISACQLRNAVRTDVRAL